MASTEVLVLFDDSTIKQEVSKRGFGGDDSGRKALLRFKKEKYREVKQAVLDAFAPGELDVVREYGHLPLSFVRAGSGVDLKRLIERPEVIAVFPDRRNYPVLSQSLPLVGQLAAAAGGYGREGATVVVLDTGCEYTRQTFGACSAPGEPGCAVVAAHDIAQEDSVMDGSSLHGTHVSGIVLGMAPSSRLAVLDVFEADGSAYDSSIIEGIDWAIEHQADYNIVAVNLSLGGGSYTSPCSTWNPYVAAVADAMDAGILVVAASGNDARTNAISYPACTPDIISVGAVYDADLGRLQWSACTDATTAVDKIACFSNSASFLDVLTPGALIHSAEIPVAKGGTSMATPHVSGAVVVLSAVYPDDTPEEIRSRIVDNGIEVTDTRNGLVFPRIAMDRAIPEAADQSGDIPIPPWATLFMGLGFVFAGRGSLRKKRLNP